MARQSLEWYRLSPYT